MLTKLFSLIKFDIFQQIWKIVSKSLETENQRNQPHKVCLFLMQAKLILVKLKEFFMYSCREILKLDNEK